MHNTYCRVLGAGTLLVLNSTTPSMNAAYSLRFILVIMSSVLIKCKAWIPVSHRLSIPALFLQLRGGSELYNNGRFGQSGYELRRSTNPSALQSVSNAEAEAEALALDALADRREALSNFGGLSYWNTDMDRRFRVLFVLGGPGAGKGTQSALMEEHYGIAHFSVGELLRSVPDDSPLKQAIEQSLVAGKIVPVEISLSLLKSAMEQVPEKKVLFLVDGFPRNYDNLSGWCSVMKDVAALEAVLVYQSPLHVLQKRILERAKVSGRSDDNLESVQKRFTTFERETMPVVETLRRAAVKQERWSVVDIAGDRSLDDVWKSTQSVLNQLIFHDVLTANAALLKAIQSRDTQSYEDLSDPNFFTDKSVDQIMQLQEGTDPDTAIECAQFDVILGKQAAVSYNRKIDGVRLREKRFWSHTKDGWKNVHFVRTPLESR
jgi:UMP-CMP kinase